jgi:hypothetical protein
MPSISTEDYPYFENKIYLPMLIAVLQKDIELINKHQFKLRRPYLTVIDKTLKLIQQDLKQTDIYLMRRSMRLVREKMDKNNEIEYTYIYSGYEERHKYTSDQLRDRSEEILNEYFLKH